MDALGRLLHGLGRIAKITGTRGIDVKSVLNGNMKHARSIEFDWGNILDNVIITFEPWDKRF